MPEIMLSFFIYTLLFILEDSPKEQTMFNCPKRPNYGTEGRKINLRANYLPIKIPSGHIYHYRINIQPDKCPRALNRDIVSTMLGAYSKSIFKDLEPVFDGKSNMYTRQPIHSLGHGEVEIDVNLKGDRRRVFRVKIGWVSEISLDELQRALEGHTRAIPLSSITALDVIIRQLPSMNYTSVGRSLFSTPKGDCYSLGSGREVWSGYYQEVRPSQWKALLNIDTSSTAFYKSQPVIEFLGDVLKKNVHELRRPLTDADRIKFGREIKGLKIEVTHCGQMKRQYRVCEVTRLPAQFQTFPLQLGNGEVECSVAKYFIEKYNIQLIYPFLQCLHVGQETKHTYLPIEVCNIVKGQRCLKKLTDIQTSTMIKKTSLSAPKRETEINQIIQKSDINIINNHYIKEFDLSIDNQLIKVDGRVLEAPTLQYKTMEGVAKQVIPRRGKWDMINKKFYNGIEIKDWAIACFACKTQVSQESLIQFVESFKRISNEAGMPIPEDPFNWKYVPNNVLQVEPYFQYLKSERPKVQLILVVLPGKTPIYAEVKRIGDTVLGIATQCIQAKNISRIGNQAQTISNIVLKVNVKLGGINNILLPEIRPEILKQPVMFLGASVAHPSAGDIRRPSIAAVVGSQDYHVSRYAATVRLQAHRIEIIKDCFGYTKTRGGFAAAL